MISLNHRDPRPIYEQVIDAFRRLIVTGTLEPGSKIPSVRELASQLAINPNTIQRAYRELESAGYIYSLPGKGSFVNEKREPDAARLKQLTNTFRELTEELRLLGCDQRELLELVGEVYNLSSGGEDK